MPATTQWLTTAIKRFRRWTHAVVCLPRTLGRIEDDLTDVLFQQEAIMAVADDIKSLLSSIDAATNDVAAKLTTLLGQVNNSMSDAEVADIKSQGAAIAARLTSLAADPVNPVPPPSPVFTSLKG